MVEPALLASPAQRRRTAVLILLCVGLSALGAFGRVGSTGTAPAPCPRPAIAGELLVCDGQGAPAGVRAWLVGERLDVNQASARELQAIPGVGPSLSRSIVRTREERGGFSQFRELDAVPGIGPKTLDKLAAWLRVAPTP